ncbi:MAG TPA: hypothetical protein VGG72_07070 [Bryobacteraceae bacterium]|jgi:hypothetical protein
MTIPPEFLRDVEAFPPVLRALLDAELAVGNQIVRHARDIPTPPVGAFLQLALPVTTRPHASGDGLRFRDFSKFGFPGSFTDADGVFYLLEPFAPELEVDMDAIRDAHSAQLFHPKIIRSDPDTPLGRLERSMAMNYEKWHDGVGYDIAALKEAAGEERGAIETLLLDQGAQGVKDWRDVEALAALGTPRANELLKTAVDNPDPEIRLAVARFAPHLVPDAKRIASLVRALETAVLFGGLGKALDEAAAIHPQPVVDALLRGALNRDGETAVNFAAMLMFVHGKANAPFDWDQRPFFLRFNTEDRDERTAVFLELCQKIEVDPSGYLRAGR